MKKAFFITIMSALLICSCQKENEEVYSCNKHLNEWAHENLQAIRSMDRDAWLNLDEEYKRPAFNALTPEQKLLFWKDIRTFMNRIFLQILSERKTSISLLQLGLLML